MGRQHMDERGFESPFHDRNPSPPPELLVGHVDLVHADNVGQSAFSKQWIFSILMRLIKTVDKENDVNSPRVKDLAEKTDKHVTDPSCETDDSCRNSENGVEVTKIENKPTKFIGHQDGIVNNKETKSMLGELEGIVGKEGEKSMLGDQGIVGTVGTDSMLDDQNGIVGSGDTERIMGKEEESVLGIDIDDDLQTELCKLWDMSTDQDVCKFLSEYQTLDLLTGIIARTKAPRVAEICAGIVANMACVEEICHTLANDHKIVELFVMLLDGRDGPTLNEVVRLLHTCMSNEKASPIFLASLKSSPETLTNLIFILNSSTNISLVKNTSELLDTLLDVDNELVDRWATGDLVDAILEAIQQLKSIGEDIDALIHSLQLLSTSDKGVDALVLHAERLQVTLQKYLDFVCEFDVGGMEGREATLSAVLAVFNLLFTSSTDVATNCMESEKFFSCLLKILEPLQQMKSTDNQSHDVSNSTSSSNQNMEPKNSLTDKKSTETNSENDDDKKDESIKTKHESDVKSNDIVDVDSREGLLYEILQGFIVDIISSIPLSHDDKENSNTSAHSLVNYLDSHCSRSRVSGLIRLLTDSSKDTLDKLRTEAKYHKLTRLLSIIDDLSDS